MIKSTDKVDKRLLDQYLIQQAHRMGVPLGFEDIQLENIVEDVNSRKAKQNKEDNKFKEQTVQDNSANHFLSPINSISNVVDYEENHQSALMLIEENKEFYKSNLDQLTKGK